MLWSAIERYASLRYGKNKHKRIAEEESFKEALKCVIGDDERKIFQTDNLYYHCLNAKNPEESIDYYYTIRCNIVHRGKKIDKKMKWFWIH